MPRGLRLLNSGRRSGCVATKAVLQQSGDCDRSSEKGARLAPGCCATCESGMIGYDNRRQSQTPTTRLNLIQHVQFALSALDPFIYTHTIAHSTKDDIVQRELFCELRMSVAREPAFWQTLSPIVCGYNLTPAPVPDCHEHESRIQECDQM